MRFVLRMSSVTALLLALLAGGALFWVSQQVQQAERQQRGLQRIVSHEEEAIRVLNAEWDYLNRPERLERMANAYLDMAPTRPSDVLQTVSSIPEPVQVPLPPKGRPVFAHASTAPVAKAAPSPAPSPAASPAPVYKPAPKPLPTRSDEPTFSELIDSLQKEGRE